MLAMILTSPPLSLQVSIYPRAPSLDAAHQFTLSISNTRFKRCAQVIDARRSAGAYSELSFATLVFLPLPHTLYRRDELTLSTVAQAIHDLGIDAIKSSPLYC